MPFAVPSGRSIKARFRVLIFGTRPRCPRCGKTDVRTSGERYHCRSCRRKFSLTSGAWLAGTKLSWTRLWMLLWCFCRRYRPRQACVLAGAAAKAVRCRYARFRTHLPSRARFLKLRAICGEAFFGKRKAGDQRIAAGAAEPHSNEIRLRIIPDQAQDSLERSLRGRASAQSTAWTDRHPAYHGIERTGYGHDRGIRERGQFAKTAPIGRVWPFAKRRARRMHHHCRASALPGFLREIERRFSAPETFASPLALAETLLRSVPTRT